MSISPNLHISNISLNLSILAAVTQPLLSIHSRCPQFYMENCTFFVSFRHRLFLIFLECPLICLVSSSISRFCSSSFSIPFTILNRVIRSPVSLLSCRVGSPISLNLSSYVTSLSSGTFFVAALWILSSFVISFFACGDHTTAAYSNLGRIILVRILFIMSLSMQCVCVCVCVCVLI